jgi:hypothetical protein
MAHADAIFPTLMLVWPITLLLLIPVIVVEGIYSRSRLNLRAWESIRLVGVANLLSTAAGLPIAHLFSAGFQYLLESIYFRGDRLRVDALKGFVEPGTLPSHDAVRLEFLGLYPRWLLLISAAVMLAICFLISWWVEAWWIARHLKRTQAGMEKKCWPVARNANILSYSILVVVVFWAFVTLWPQGLTSFLHHP